MLLGLGGPALFPQVCEQTREAALYFTPGSDLPVKGRFDREARVIPLVPACLGRRNFGWRARRHQKRAGSKLTLCVEAEGDFFGPYDLLAGAFEPLVAGLAGPQGEHHAGRLVVAELGPALADHRAQHRGILRGHKPQRDALLPAATLDGCPDFTIRHRTQERPEFRAHQALAELELQKLETDARLTRDGALKTFCMIEYRGKADFGIFRLGEK